MARLPRDVIPGQPQRITKRGDNRQAIFAAESDYQFFELPRSNRLNGLAVRYIEMNAYFTRS